MRISDWSSDVCSSDLRTAGLEPALPYGKQILSLLRLPISPRPHNFVAGRDDRSCRSSAELRIDRQARDIPAHEQRAAVYVRLFSVQSFTHFLARFEIGNAFGVHFHRFPGARIAAGPCVTASGGKCSESPQFDAAPRGKTINNFLKKEIDDLLDFLKRQLRILFRQFLNQFRSDHPSSPTPHSSLSIILNA